MPSQPVGLQKSFHFGEDFELDLRSRRLRRGSRVLKLERIPLERVLLLLVIAELEKALALLTAALR